MYYNGHKVRFVNGYPAIYIDEENYTVYLHILEMEKHLGVNYTTKKSFIIVIEIEEIILSIIYCALEHTQITLHSIRDVTL